MPEEDKRWTILAVLDWTRGHFESKGLESPRLDAEILIADALGTPRVMLYARFDQPLSQEERTHIREMVARRARGEPIAYIVGSKEIYSLELEVTPDVLIPRPDTEVLIEIAIARVRPIASPLVADVGTGSGCIAIAIAKHVANARIYALDRSPRACVVAEKNAAKHGVAERVLIRESDLLSAIPPSEPLDLVTANLPYIPTGEIPALMRSVRDFEPRTALDGGPDGLDLIRRLGATLEGHLKPGGIVLFEIGHDQAEAVRADLGARGFRKIETHRDLAGVERVIEATRA